MRAPAQPENPLPPDQLEQYSPERDCYAAKDITDYMLLERPDERALHVEHIKTEYVLGSPYDIRDVTTDKSRWWVLTNPINLYPQRNFPTLDFTLAFHIGLTIRVCSRLEREGEPEPTPFDEVSRRQRQASVLLEQAVEAVDFQGVGMRLRECLISLIAAVRRRVEVKGAEERPKDADVIGWNKLLVAQLCPGEKNDEIRNYLKAMIEKLWQLTNALTHQRNANKTTALIAVDAVAAIVKH